MPLGPGEHNPGHGSDLSRDDEAPSPDQEEPPAVAE